MDVYPPHEPVHTWRDALAHLAIVTVGLFIALMLESLVEYVHHRELVKEARENIRSEIEQNRTDIGSNLASLDKEASLVKNGLTTMRYLQAHPHAHGSITFNWVYAPLHDAAWHTARDTGALGYMPYKDVQGYTDLYGLQTTVSAQILGLVTREAEVVAPLMALEDDGSMKLPDAQYESMLRDAAVISIDLQTLRQLMTILDQGYSKTLNKN